jgi:hypothetical protein
MHERHQQPEHQRDPDTWDDASLTEAQVSPVSWLAVVMSAWNRVAISSHYPVAP